MEYLSVITNFPTKYHPITTFLFYVSDHNDPGNNLNCSPLDGKLPIKRRFYTQIIFFFVLFLIKQVPGCRTQPQRSGKIHVCKVNTSSPVRNNPNYKADFRLPRQILVPLLHHYPSSPLDPIFLVTLKDDFQLDLRTLVPPPNPNGRSHLDPITQHFFKDSFKPLFPLFYPLVTLSFSRYTVDPMIPHHYKDDPNPTLKTPIRATYQTKPSFHSIYTFFNGEIIGVPELFIVSESLLEFTAVSCYVVTVSVCVKRYLSSLSALYKIKYLPSPADTPLLTKTIIKSFLNSNLLNILPYVNIVPPPAPFLPISTYLRAYPPDPAYNQNV